MVHKTKNIYVSHKRFANLDLTNQIQTADFQDFLWPNFFPVLQIKIDAPKKDFQILPFIFSVPFPSIEYNQNALSTYLSRLYIANMHT